jgi:Short C-terminal domain
MFGRDWEPVVGTVVDTQYHGGQHFDTGPLTTSSTTYVVEARLQSGETVRQDLDDVIGRRQISIAVGARVPLLAHGTRLKWNDDDALLKVARGIGVTTAERRASGYLDDEQWEHAVHALRGQADHAPPPARTETHVDPIATGPDIADQLAKLVQLQAQGFLSDAQFELAKQQLLGQ